MEETLFKNCIETVILNLTLTLEWLLEVCYSFPEQPLLFLLTILSGYCIFLYFACWIWINIYFLLGQLSLKLTETFWAMLFYKTTFM